MTIIRAVTRAAILICLASVFVCAQDAEADDAPQTPPQPTQTTPAPQAPQVPAPASPYTHAYEIRKNIHKYASYATLPLFAAEYALGESLGSEPDGGSGAARGMHAALGTGIVGLFVVNTVTGGWNLWQSRHEKEHRTPRIIHSALMIASNAGFVATAAVTPSHHNTIGFENDRKTHRNLAIASISIGTAGYLLALFKKL